MGVKQLCYIDFNVKKDKKMDTVGNVLVSTIEYWPAGCNTLATKQTGQYLHDSEELAPAPPSATL